MNPPARTRSSRAPIASAITVAIAVALAVALLLPSAPDAAQQEPKREPIVLLDLMPAVCKQEVLLTRIFPKYGKPSDGTRYYTVESNPRTAFMYAGYDIPALRVWDDWQYVDSTRAAK